MSQSDLQSVCHLVSILHLSTRCPQTFPLTLQLLPLPSEISSFPSPELPCQLYFSCPCVIVVPLYLDFSRPVDGTEHFEAFFITALLLHFQSSHLHLDPIPFCSCCPASNSVTVVTELTDRDYGSSRRINGMKCMTALCVIGCLGRTPNHEYNKAALRMTHKEVPAKPWEHVTLVG